MRGPTPPSGRSLELTRRARRILALRSLGINAETNRGFASQVAAAGQETAIHSLPEDTSQQLPLQNDAGFFRFIDGFSDENGPDWF